MVKPNDIKSKIENKKSEYLKAKILGTAFFPLSLRSDKGSIQDDFGERELAMTALFAQSKAKKGKGYIVETKTQDSRTMGKQTAIANILVETEQDFLYLLQAETQGNLFTENLALLRSYFPEKELLPWLLAKKTEIFAHWQENEGKWFCEISRFLVDNPNCALFPRELKVEAPTKFLENNLALIKSLVGSLRPLAEGDDDITRLGLRKKESLVKIRAKKQFKVLSEGVVCGHTPTIILTPESFLDFNLEAKRIFIVENETMFFTFPLQENDLCVYSGGYALLACKKSKLLANSEIFYFGDLDEHGFAILDKFRAFYPHTRSFCMDSKALEDHRSFLIKGKAYPGEYHTLTTEELETVRQLQAPSGPLLLEQERIALHYLKNRLQNLTNG
jgi:hypothetical protein